MPNAFAEKFAKLCLLWQMSRLSDVLHRWQLRSVFRSAKSWPREALYRALCCLAEQNSLTLTALGPVGIDAAAGSAQHAAGGSTLALVPLAAPHHAMAALTSICALSPLCSCHRSVVPRLPDYVQAPRQQLGNIIKHVCSVAWSSIFKVTSWTDHRSAAQYEEPMLGCMILILGHEVNAYGEEGPPWRFPAGRGAACHGDRAARPARSHGRRVLAAAAWLRSPLGWHPGRELRQCWRRPVCRQN